MKHREKTAIIIGAGPAGLTVAYELLMRTDIKPIIFEKTSAIGGISQTVEYKGNRIDIGGHRFFSKSERVMRWWFDIMPLQVVSDSNDKNSSNTESEPYATFGSNPSRCDPQKNDRVMLIRKRLSRIYYLQKFFNYPLSLNLSTLMKLGILTSFKIGLSYMRARLFPIRDEKSLEDFLINRFGKTLYQTFFKDYSEKVRGVPCSQLNPAWGRQRIKGLSISKAIQHSLKLPNVRNSSISQRKTETSLIKKFLYPKYGPGQLWEEVCRRIESKGGKLYLNHEAIELCLANSAIDKVFFKNHDNGETVEFSAAYIISTMPIRDLVSRMRGDISNRVRRIADGLHYRDFITVGMLLSKFNTSNTSFARNGLVLDNWIYIQERDVKIGRIQIFNNWSPFMVSGHDKIWIGLEYFCNEGDDFWIKDDDALMKFAVNELVKIGIVEAEDILDSVVIRTQKAYPAYHGAYQHFNVIRSFTDTIENLFLIGRNGMHKYNNQDHSMLTAMITVDNIISGVKSRENIWSVNTEDEYQEVVSTK
jgi:protoporphyrinogen oxidase